MIDSLTAEVLMMMLAMGRVMTRHATTLYAYNERLLACE